MALNFIYGVSGSGKTQYIFENIIKNEKHRVLIVVPEQFTHETERRVLKEYGSTSKFGIDVLSFERIGARVFSECGQRVKERVTNVGKGVIVSKILSETNLTYYKNSAQNPGFVQLCADTLSEFKKYNISPESLKEAYQKESGNILRAKTDDFYKIFCAYLDILGDDYTDSDDILDLVLSAMENSNFFKNTIVVFDEFSSFIPTEINIIKKIVSDAAEVYMALCTNTLICDDITKSSLFAPTVITADKLIKACCADGLKIGKKTHLENLKRHKNTKMLGVLNKALCENRFGTGKKINGEIKLFYDQNPYFEAENTAKEILRLTRDFNYRYNEIGVICANLSEYSQLIKSVFSSYNIPCFIDEKKEALSHRLVLFVLGALDIYIENYSYDSIFSFLRLGLCNLTDYEIDALENYVLAQNIKKSAWENDEKWNYTLKIHKNNQKLSEKFTQTVCAARDKFMSEIKPFHDKIKGRKKASDIVYALYEYLTGCGFFDKIEAQIDFFEKTNDVKNAKEYLAADSAIISTFDEIAKHLGDETVNVREFRNLLYSAFSMQKQGYVPYSSDNIIVGNADRTVSKDIKALFIIGAVDGMFPTPKKSSGIFGDGEREILAQNGVELSETSKTKAFYNKFLIYNCVTAPERLLYISFPICDSASNALRPAFLFSTIRKIFPDLQICIRDNKNESDLDKVTLLKPTLEPLIDAIKENNPSPVWIEVYRYLLENDKNQADRIKGFFCYTPDFSGISKMLIEKIFGGEIYSSVSKLQTFRSCPFMYFLKYVLKLEEKEIFSLNAADVGTFVHMVFEKICKQIEEDKTDFAAADDDFIKERISYYINSEVEKIQNNVSEAENRSTFIIKRLGDAVFSCFDILKFHIINSSFIPLGYEITFGKDGKTRFDIQTDDGKTVHLMGIIDRADKFETQNGTFVRIIDYKTGSKTFSLSNMFYGLDVQLMVYLSALTESDNSEYKKAGALYFKFDDYIYKANTRTEMSKSYEKMKSALKLKGIILNDKNVIAAYDPVSKSRAKLADEKNFDLLSNHIKNGIKTLCNKIFEGDFSVCPTVSKDASPCSYCDYGAICKIDITKNFGEELKPLSDEEVWKKLEVEENVD
ncbi:MAG: PD-(D/E)XK nuclease family protein [Clostridia bacterium]|nr:PD-(D/E)XK nuclease family protein [Clostridia bacterium]